MVGKGSQIVISTTVLVLMALMALFIIKPFSIIHFIGPIAGIASAFTIAWGFSILISIVFAMSLLSLILMFITGETLEFSIFMIALLAILLQSFWAKQLVVTLVQQQKWLKNRNILLSFIFKIGPLASLVSACAVIVVAILDDKSFGSSTFFIFFSSWASSSLTVMFFTPAILFTQGVQQLSATRRVFVVLASALASLSVVLLFTISQHAQQYQRFEQFKQNKANVTRAITKEVDDIRDQLRALAAFFKSSEQVSYSEFQTFTSGIFTKSLSVKSLAWVPYVDHQRKDEFQQFLYQQVGIKSAINEQLVSGQAIEVSDQVDYFPILYIYPLKNNELLLGLDLQQHDAKFKAMNLARKYKKMIATAPVTLASNDFSSPSILIFDAIKNTSSNLLSNFSTSSNIPISGFVVAEVQFNPFFQELAKSAIAQTLRFSIQENTLKEPFLLYGENFKLSSAKYSHIEMAENQVFSDAGRLTEVINLEVFSRQWQVTINEKNTWSQQAVSWQMWMMLIGGTIGAFVFQLLILMMAAYSTELSHQVVLKTRELILAKEGSEQQSSAKSNFLATLGAELKTPVNAIGFFVAKFRQHPTFQQAERSIEDIADAGQALSKIIDSVLDFTQIEAGSPSLQLSVFDFHVMLHRLEVLLNVTYEESRTDFKFAVGSNVPIIIESDELRLNKLMIVLAEIANNIFSSQHFSFSIKAHLHQLKRATLFFVVSPIGNSSLMNNKQITMENGEKDLDFHSISMTMAKGVSQLFDGDVKLSQLPSGERVLTASVKINLPPDGYDVYESKE